ncbi:MAG: polymerase sigma-70 factor,ECF subfamily [Armatimonadetes bacterium]|nr:polymerase sigma-70 factor,ECF subfamily [Armatimonadota bacterium]
MDQWPKRFGDPEELRLVRSVLDGDGSAFASLVQRHGPQVASAARRFVRDPNDLDDVVQETFLRAYRSLKRFRGGSSLRTWLIQIALNVCRDRQRTFWKRRIVLTTDADALDQVPSSQAPVSETTALHQTIEAAVARLPEHLRLPFVLHAFEELSGIEIAAVLGWSESTVWTRIYAARKKLREQLGDSLQR